MYVGIIFTLGAVLCSSVGYIFIKRGLESADYRVFILLSVLVGLVLSGLLLWSVGPGLSGLSLRLAFPFIITGSLGGGLLTRISETMAADQIGVSKTHALVSTSPLITALIGITLLGEQGSLRLTLGTLIVVIGASLLSYLCSPRDQNNLSMRQNHPLFGLGLAFYAAIMLGIQPVMQKLGLELGALPLQGMFIRFLTAAGFYVIYLIVIDRDFRVGSLQKVSDFVFASFVWALSPLLILLALERLPTTVFAPLFRVGPIFTFTFTRLFLGGIEDVNWLVGFSTLIIVFGVVLVTTA